ncbi:FAD-dependent monooxygenase [Actinomadura barringtoniae]|uniref:FAD-dependent monooxygenase n=1 Tax=Actinomadura barringtoniae TaxID=1427535 RepID=A0A939PVQ0_9ACTN|nr:FAD-dependent oxidoreductase [Actinomadura barringtoniae]MBO2455701.1 FAD-dependent monooxygenase [Actinomadura barringtoniae]
MRVLIVGGGVAGLAAARGLTAAGHDVQVYEAAPELRTEGGSVTIWPGAIGVLREFEVDMDGAGRRLETMENLSPGGRLRGKIDLSVAEREFGGLYAVHIARRELVGRLADGVRVDYGRRIAGVDPERAEITFADGTSVRGDVLIGADGRNSVVREALGGRPTRLNGWVTWQAFTTLPTEYTDDGRSMMVSDGRSLASLAPLGNGRMLWWFDLRAKPGGDFWAEAPGFMERMRKRFGRLPEPFPTLLEQAESMDFYPHHRHRVPSTWGKGPTTLIGDAAHTMSPAMAMGSGQALEDAWVLSRMADDLRGYERARAKNVRKVARMANLELPSRQGRLGGLASDARATRSFASLLRSASGYLQEEGTNRNRPAATAAVIR